MRQLPRGWSCQLLGEIAKTITKGTTPTTLGYKFQSEGIPFIKVENIESNRINIKSVYQYISEEAHSALSRSAFEEGDVLFSIAGTIGKTALISASDLPCNTNQAIAIIRGTGNVLLPLYLKYNLSYRANEIFSANARGGAINNVSLGDLKKINIVIPPLAEQNRIVEKLDEVLAQVDTIKARLDGIPAILKRFRQSVLAAAVSGKLTKEWRGKFEEPKAIAIAEESLYVPSCWNTSTLESLMQPSRKICYGVVQPGELVDGGQPLIRVCDINNGVVDYSGLRTISHEIDSQYQRSKVQKDDLLVTIVGAIGRVAIVTEDIKANIARAVARLSPNADIVIPKFLLIWLSCPKLQWWLNNSSREVARKTLNLSELKHASVALPPIEEQKEIVRLVEQYFAFADTIEAQVKKAQARVDKLTQSILAKAFRGELVPQDPNDEPADKLLERIAAARKEAEALAKAAKKAGRKKVTA